mmetsp:Transcript_2889/g.9538  ORF Transcript_2889/g.9538 Transcript_2889/m.9538 type:complete len:89 (-) Transcript_2889:1123-1389(-)
MVLVAKDLSSMAAMTRMSRALTALDIWLPLAYKAKFVNVAPDVVPETTTTNSRMLSRRKNSRLTEYRQSGVEPKHPLRTLTPWTLHGL